MVTEQHSRLLLCSRCCCKDFTTYAILITSWNKGSVSISPRRSTEIKGDGKLIRVFQTSDLSLLFTHSFSRSSIYWTTNSRQVVLGTMDVQFSSVTQSCLTLCNPMNRSTPGLPVHHQLPESTQTHVHRVGDGIQPSHPLSSPFPLALNLSQHQGLFQWDNSSHQVAKVLEFQLQHQSFQWTPRT